MPGPRPAYSSRQRVLVFALAAGVPIVIGIVAVCLVAAWRADLPDRIAIHWNAAGVADDYTGFWGVVLPILGLAAVLAAAFSLSAVNLGDEAPPARGRLLVAASIGTTTALTTAIVALVGLQRGGAPTPGIHQIGQWLLIGIGFGAALGVLAFLVAPKSVRVEPGDDQALEPIELSPQERAVWTGVAAPSRRFALLYAGVTVVALGVAILAVTRQPGAIVVAFVPLLIVLSTTVLRWRVTVSRNGFSARGALGVPHFHIALSDVESARSVRVDAFSEFGGWGLRWGAGRTGIILRSGDAIEIRRRHGRALVVTVADAATGVALLNGFLARARA